MFALRREIYCYLLADPARAQFERNADAFFLSVRRYSQGFGKLSPSVALKMLSLSKQTRRRLFNLRGLF
jgi:hypothetical protein